MRFRRLFRRQEHAVLAYADCLVQAGELVPREIFQELKTFWKDKRIFETRALRMEFDARDDPIVEVAAPEDFNVADFLSAPRPTS